MASDRVQAIPTTADALFKGILIEAMYTPGNHRQLALSLSRDPLLGPVISLGAGGKLTNLMHERIVQLPPLNNFLIEEVLSNRQLQIYCGAFRHNEAIAHHSRLSTSSVVYRSWLVSFQRFFLGHQSTDR